MARSAGYCVVEKVNEKIGLQKAILSLQHEPGPIFLLVKVVQDEPVETAGRVTLSPEEIRDRFMSAIGAGS